MKTPRCGVPDVIEGYQNLVDLGDDEVGDIDEESDREAYYPSRRRYLSLFLTGNQYIPM